MMTTTGAAASLKETGDDAPLIRTLAQAMVECEDARTASLQEEGKKQIQYPQSNQGFFRTLLMIQGRALDLMVWPWTLVVVHAAIYTVIQEVVYETERKAMESWTIFFRCGAII